LLPDEAERATESGEVAASVATDSSIRMRVDAVGEDTALAGIQRLVAEAQVSKSQGLADRAAALLFYEAVTVAAVTVAVLSLLSQPDRTLRCSVTVLIIAAGSRPVRW
jgi:Cu2+-exporting ATPase